MVKEILFRAFVFVLLFGALGLSWIIGVVCGFHLAASNAAVKWFNEATGQIQHYNANAQRLKDTFNDDVAEFDARGETWAEGQLRRREEKSGETWPDEIEIES